MKRIGRRKNRSFLKGAAAIIAAAVLIRLMASDGSGEKIGGLIKGRIESESFFKNTLSGESAAIYPESESAFSGLFEDCAASAAEAKIKEQTALPVWTYTPGGEKNKDEHPIEDITIAPNGDKGYVKYQNILVKNDSSKGIDLKWLLGAKLPFKLTGNGPYVLVIHTHASESYLPQGRETYTLTDVERTEDKTYNMIRVGDELTKALEENGIPTLHDRNIYDSPSYNGSYTRTLAAIGKALRENPSIKVVIDVHRDAMTAKDGIKYRTVTEINGEKYAQMMIVMSTGESGLPHPDWAENLKLAVKLQNALASKYKNLMRPINLRKERFNMHATKGSMLVEVGTSANSLLEAINSVKLLGRELAPILKTARG